MSDLIERLAAAEAGSRELDAEIMFDLFAKPVGEHEADGGPVGYIRPDDEPTWNFGLRFPGKDQAWVKAARERLDGETLLIERDNAIVLMNSMRIPKLTTSLDAALTLVPEGWENYGSISWPGRDYGKWIDEAKCELHHCLSSGGGPKVQGYGKSPAVAVCLAALRARLAP